MRPQKEPNALPVSQMTRRQLIEGLLRLNEHSSFQFTEDWLNKQWTYRLRALLADRLLQEAALGSG